MAKHWRERLADITTIEEMRDLVAEAITTQIPAVRAVRATGPKSLAVSWVDPDLGESTAFLGGLWKGFAQCRSLRERLERIEGFLDTVRHPLEASTEDRTAERLLPVVRSQRFVSAVAEHGVSLEGASHPLAGDLWVVYEFDFPTTTVTATAEDANRLGLREEEMYELGLAHLRRLLLPKIQTLALGGGLYGVSADNNNESGVLLLDEYWRDREVIAAVPARDALLFSDGSATRRTLQEAVDRAFARAPYPVSRTLLTRRGHSWIALPAVAVP